jgi:hypothetical protein
MRAWYQALKSSLEGVVLSVKDFGAVGNGSIDDTTAFLEAIAFAADNFNVLYVPAGNYKITAELALPTSITIYGDGPEASVIEPHLTSTGGNIFSMTANGNLVVRDIGFDGDDVTNPTPTTMVYMIHVDPSSGTLENINIDNVRFSNLNLINGTYGVEADADLRVTHCIFLDNVDNVAITNCHVTDVSGSFCYAQYVNHIKVEDNYLKNVAWYPIHFEARVRFFNIAGNYFNQAATAGSVLGGFIDVLEDTTVAIPESGADTSKLFYNNGIIQHNYMEGRSAYASIINVLSVSGVTIKDNIINGIARGTLNVADGFIYNIHVGTRAASTIAFYGPPINVIIEGNMIRSTDNGGVFDYGIRVDNNFQSASVPNERRPVENVLVKNNIIGFHLYNKGSAYADINMDKGIYFDGGNGGIQNITCEDNHVINVNNTQVSTDGAGVIDFTASNSAGKIDGVKIGGNRLEINGTASASTVTGIYIDQYVANVVNTKPNYFNKFYTAVETVASGSGGLYYLDDQVIEASTGTNYIFGTALTSVYHTNLAGNTAARPASGENLTDYMTYYDTTVGTPLWYDGAAWVNALGGAAGAAYISATGTPVDNQLATFTDANTVEGTSTLTYDGTTLTVSGDISGTTIGGITEANLVDKTATEVVTGAWDFGGAADLEIPNGATPTVDTAGQIAIDTTVTDYTGLIKYHDGVEELTAVGMPTANLSTTDGDVVAYNAANNEFEMVAQAGGSADDAGLRRSWMGI